jgi:hypothetical protein
MRKRFVVAVDPSTTEQRQAFKDYLKASPLAWWSWITGFWLIVDPDGNLTAAALRDKVNEFFPDLDTVVPEFRADGTDTWAGSRAVGGPKMFDWIRSTWRKLT